jgi:alpha-1,6-mannosyltransferase
MAPFLATSTPAIAWTRDPLLARLGGLGLALLSLELLGLIAHEQNNLLGLVLLLLAGGMTFTVAVGQIYHCPETSRHATLLILAFAALYRALLVPLDPPRLSTDVYRYVWDGKVEGAGINPYLYTPSDPKLAFLRDAKIYPNINRREYAHTIYPPVAQLFFWLVTRVSPSVWGMKAATATVDMGTILLLAHLLARNGLPPARALVYAWHPLPIWEFAGTGHIDALMIFLTLAAFTALTTRRTGWAGATLAAGALTKFLPFALVPAFLRRRDVRFLAATLATVLLMYGPYAAGAGARVLGFLPQYAHEEGYVGGERFYILRLADAGASVIIGRPMHIPIAVFEVGSMLAYLALAVSCLAANGAFPFRTTPFPSGSNTMAAARQIRSIAVFVCIVLSPNYPWYYGWVVPWLALAPSAPALLMTLTVFVLYRSINEYSSMDYFWLHSQIFLPVLVWIALQRLASATRPFSHEL